MTADYLKEPIVMNNGLIRTSSRMLLSLTLTLTALGCADMPDGVMDSSENVGEAQGAIQNGTAANLWTRARVASIGNCTATIIGRRHLLTASHCVPAVGNGAYFYTSADLDYAPVNWNTARTIDAVYYRSGVDAPNGDYTDSYGNFADIAVVRLSSDIPSTSAAATMAWSYPSGGDDWGSKVGCGNHDGGSNGDDDLRSVPDQTYSDNDGDGHFLTENEQTNPGDSGGPFFYSNRVLGVLYGDVFEWEMRNKYTSVQAHLHWILTAMGYTFPGTTSSGVIVNGTTSSNLFTSSSQECSYICDKTSSCVAFNYLPWNVLSSCQLKSSNTGTSIQGGATSGVK
jgi:hypothetical protein